MALTPEEILGYLGDQFKDVESMDDFKGKFGKQYYTMSQIHESKDLLKKVMGRTFGTITGNQKQIAKKYEIEIEDGVFADQDPEKATESILEAYAKKQETIVNELKEQIGKTGEDAIKPWKEKLDKYELSLNDQKKMTKDLADALEKEKQNAANTVKTFKVGYAKKDVMTSIGYDTTVMKDELKRKGWESHVEENFRFDFDESDQFIVTDKAGNKIKNPKKADEWLAPKDVLTFEADKLGLLPKNHQGGNPAPKQFGNPAPKNNGEEVKKDYTMGRKIAPWLEGK